ncbi:DMT family transporter [Psychrobacter phenylpyruvicus]|uniref:Predicted permease, DMT superfamily n=1 Tax=Psychrobacter phenylpyruvicus TaxID=29432 RepID=A0A379LLQ6_9GAMM|nr:EamA family transporter [Psychrobacter phenylpyruvicus]SUD90827.1 Predicted permease, DMT superfamily [Psychrobacter phenylpyruvicus]
MIKNTSIQSANKSLGAVFALSAAALNATIGIISILLMNTGLKSNDIAFFKTLIAFLLLTVLLSKTPIRQQHRDVATLEFNNPTLKRVMVAVAVCAFLGIFTLFVFETQAYQYGNPANVVVILMATATISATLFGALLLKNKITINTIVGVLLAVVGIFVISWSSEVNLQLVIFASLAGSGYGVFSVLMQRFGLKGGIYLTKYLLLFGSLFLFIPFMVTFDSISIGYQAVLGLLGLAIFPTILGFYCTTSALKHLPASKVQVVELSEPLFAMLFAWVILHEVATMRFWIGGALVIFGILAISDVFRKKAI